MVWLCKLEFQSVELCRDAMLAAAPDAVLDSTSVTLSVLNSLLGVLVRDSVGATILVFMPVISDEDEALKESVWTFETGIVCIVVSTEVCDISERKADVPTFEDSPKSVSDVVKELNSVVV